MTVPKRRVVAGCTWLDPVGHHEYGFSAFAGRAMVQMPSALLIADFLGRGGSAAYLYGYPPDDLLDGDRPCSGKGNMMLWQMDAHGMPRWAMPLLCRADEHRPLRVLQYSALQYV